MNGFDSKELWSAWLLFKEMKGHTSLVVKELVKGYGYRPNAAITLVRLAREKHGG